MSDSERHPGAPGQWDKAPQPPMPDAGAVGRSRFTDEPLIDIRALAAWFAVSESAVRKWVAMGPEGGLAPRFIRINGQVRFRPSDVREFLLQREVR